MPLSTSEIRNVLLAGQHGAGKTSLADGLLVATGATSRRGSPASGDSFSDFEKDEKAHGHSIYPAVLHFQHDGALVNLIDSPGLLDLLGPAMACVPAVETLAVVVNAESGIEAVTERMMEVGRERNLARAIIVNRIDASELDLAGLLEELKERFGPGTLPINLPAERGTRVVDCLLDARGTSDLGPVEMHHKAIIERVVEIDDTLMESYLGGTEPNYEALHAPFERAMDEGHIIPVCFTSAKAGVGLVELAGVMARHFPSPLEGNPRPFLTGAEGQETPFEYANDPARPLLGHVFRVTSDPYVGKICFLRVHQGRIGAGSQVFVGHSKRPVKIGHLLRMQGKEQEEVKELIAGEIGAVSKIEEITVGDVLHDDHALDWVHLEPLKFPMPLYGLAVTPKSRGDEQKISRLLQRMQEEDPTFRMHTDPETHEMVIHGMGELHLRLAIERLQQRGVQVDTRPPRIPYRETISGNADGHYRHKKQTGGAGQFAEVFLRVEPLERGAGFEFVDDVFGGAIPKQFIPAVEKGVRDAMERGIVAGYPVQDVRVVVTDGKTHPVDSKEVAFRTAGRFAFQEGFLKASPVVLEPFVTLEVFSPSDYVGAVTGDLSSRRGRVLGTDLRAGGTNVVRAHAPLAEVLQYETVIRSITGGQGSLAMEFSHYEPVPGNVQAELSAKFRPAEAE